MADLRAAGRGGPLGFLPKPLGFLSARGAYLISTRMGGVTMR